MQGDITPFKESMSKNEAYPDFTSGKKKRKVYMNLGGAHRKDQVSGSYQPLVNIMPTEQSSPQQQGSPQGNNSLNLEQQQTEENCHLKQQCMKHIRQCYPSRYQQIYEMMAQRAQLKQQGEQRTQQLVYLKKGTIKWDFKLQQLKELTANQVEEVRLMIHQQEQSMYYMNRYIYDREKEKEGLVVEGKQINASYAQLLEQIRVNLIEMEQLIGAEREKDECLEALKVSYAQIMAHIKEGARQLAVLKMQVSPQFRVSFQSLNCSYSTRKRILQKNPNLWQRRNKLLLHDEIKYFLLIQLYPGWRKLLDRLPCKNGGYRELFFEEAGAQSVLEDLDDYIFSNPKIIKYKSSIVIYSQRQEPYIEIREMLQAMVGLRNCFIKVIDVNFEKTPNEIVEKVTISYVFKGEDKIKTFELVQLRELTRDALQAYMPSSTKPDRTSLIRIEIPFYFESPAERIRLEDIYRMIERGV